MVDHPPLPLRGADGYCFVLAFGFMLAGLFCRPKKRTSVSLLGNQEGGSVPAPLLVLGSDIVGDENNLSGPADELRRFRAGPRSDDRKERGAVGGCDRYPAIARLRVIVDDEFEAELAQVELQGLVLIAHQDDDALYPEVRTLAVRA